MKLISFQRRAGDRAPQLEGLLLAVLEAAEDAVLVEEEGAGILYANRAAGSLLGYERTELEGKALREIASNLAPERWLEMWK